MTIPVAKVEERHQKLAHEFMGKWVAEHYVVKGNQGPMENMPTGDVENMLAAFAAALSAPSEAQHE